MVEYLLVSKTDLMSCPRVHYILARTAGIEQKKKKQPANKNRCVQLCIEVSNLFKLEVIKEGTAVDGGEFGASPRPVSVASMKSLSLGTL